jgi:uncharacterized protein YjbI with pentapeptide repeats
MAHPEHVALIKQGAEALAAWREAHPDERLDLDQADLEGVDLRGAPLQQARLREAYLVAADLSGAHLQQARLVKTNLERARLPWARLHRAHLHGAHLQQATLREANLQGTYLVLAHLVGADLAGAHLERADLQWANLQQANLAGARLQAANLQEVVLGDTVFADTNLNGVQGLETCRHQGPSRLDLGTLAQSGLVPEAFLRGCGWPQDVVASVAGLLQERPLHTTVERSIALPPASYQAGLALLAAFGPILAQQYPDLPASLRLEPRGLLVRLLVETPEAHRDTVEHTLRAYGSVLAGHQRPEDVFTDAQQLLPAAAGLGHLRRLVGEALCDG